MGGGGGGGGRERGLMGYVHDVVNMISLAPKQLDLLRSRYHNLG